MYLNAFSIRITEGSEKTSGYVELSHGKQYTIVLRNDHNVRCNAEVNIDGKAIGTFRIAANSTIRLERKPDDDGKFTFYRLGSEEAGKSDLESVSENDLGLLKIVFTPELQLITTYTDYPWTCIDWNSLGTTDALYGPTIYGGDTGSGSITANCYSVRDNAPGGTGLSGHSNRWFIGAEDIYLDYSQQTTIHLRLVEERKPEDQGH